MDFLSTSARILFTVILLGLTIWWLTILAGYIGAAPVKDDKGNTVFDAFQRGKDILIAILPVLSGALGYWFGSSGREKADQRAQESQTTAQEARGKSEALLAAATPEVLKAAKEFNPAAFKAQPPATGPAATPLSPAPPGPTPTDDAGPTEPQ
ncbi:MULTISPECIES: hypothetical protein [Arthrobacter]|uniref:Phospholipase_D-nuclease N-terminal n=2 Tax=Arthrobacter TaxID=1663 RepID=A0ABU9KJU6_9MICC|nr:hypothetical protein [Arthrobacter sp. YJM1]MDP5227164.1 hypothetical protein [Arthrobacter sp. YJM1]